MKNETATVDFLEAMNMYLYGHRFNGYIEIVVSKIAKLSSTNRHCVKVNSATFEGENFHVFCNKPQKFPLQISRLGLCSLYTSAGMRLQLVFGKSFPYTMSEPNKG